MQTWLGEWEKLELGSVLGVGNQQITPQGGTGKVRKRISVGLPLTCRLQGPLKMAA